MIQLLLWATVVAISAAIYNVVLKKVSHRFIFSFWVTFFTFIAMTILFYIKQLEHGISISATTQRISLLARTNIPLYAILMVFLMLQIALKAHIFEKHSISKIIPILEIGTPMTTFLYFLLGDPVTSFETIGIGIISFGAIISGFKYFYFPNIFKPLFDLSGHLYISGLTLAGMGTIENIISYITTEKNHTTTAIFSYFKTTQILNYFTFTFIDSLEYLAITSIFFIICFIFYFIIASPFTFSKIKEVLTHNKKAVALASVANTLSQYTYYYIYTGDEQSIVVALTKFSIPLTLALAYLTFKEKISTPEKVGVSLIIIGGIIATL